MNDRFIGIIGAGTVGSALAVVLARAGFAIAGIASRNPASAQALAARLPGKVPALDTQAVVDRAGLVILTVPDDAIQAVATGLAWPAGRSVVHCSGAATSDLLAPAAAAGTRIGSFHPLQTFAGVEDAIALLPDSTFAVETADERLARTLEALASAIGARSIRLRAEDKAAYHLSAVLVSNYLVTLTQLATDLWAGFGRTPAEARQALVPLIEGVTRSIAAVGLPDCLTGPVARGDLGTIARHRQVLLEQRPDLLGVYRELGLQTVPIALAKGRIDVHRGEELRKAFQRCRETAATT